MTPQQFVGFGVRLFAIWLLLGGVSSYGSYFAALRQPGVGEAAWTFLLVPTMYCIVAAALWLFPMSVAHWLVPKTRFENVLSAAPLELGRVGTAMLGLWLVATSLPWLGSFLTSVALLEVTSTSLFSTLGPDARFYLVEQTLRIGIGCVFVFASAQVARRILSETSNEATSQDL